MLFLAFLLADIIPQGVEDFGQELAAAWPIVIALIFVVGIISTVGRKAWKRLIDEIRQQINPVKKEFENNGGESMRDLVDDLMVFAHTLDSKVSMVLAKLNAHQIRLDNLVASADEPWFESDEHGKLKWVNNAYLREFEMSYIDALENKFIDMIDENSLDGFNFTTADAANLESDWTSIFDINLPSGLTKTIRGHSQPVYDVDGNFSGWVGTLIVIDRN